MKCMCTLLFVKVIGLTLLWLLALVLAFGPMVYGMYLCLNNDRLSGGMKALWCLAFIFSSLLALVVYLALYKSRGDEEEQE